MFAIADCNNFYASCERVFQPKLEGKPIVVLSNNDGCVIARSAEAKLLQVAMGAPYFKIEHYCKQEGIAVFSSNFALYGDLSQRVMQVISGYAQRSEVYKNTGQAGQSFSQKRPFSTRCGIGLANTGFT